jgi:hypothetical protein
MKKIGLMGLLVVATLLLTIAFPAAAANPQPAAKIAPVVTALPAAAPVAAVAAMPAPPHPHIHEAIESMRAAKHHMESAEHDFDGHRAKAIEHLDRAIREAEICMEMK